MTKFLANNLVIWSHWLLYLKLPSGQCHLTVVRIYSWFNSSNIIIEKSADFSGIQTRIVRVDDKHADYLSTTKGQEGQFDFALF